MPDIEPAAPAPAPRTVTLPDDGTIVLRQIHADDKQRLLDAFERLGTESRYRRFLGPHDRLTDRETRYFTEVDHVAHEAMIALDPAADAIVGVARYVADPARPDHAEMAVAIVDDWQGRTVGTALLHALVERARTNGVRCFTASVLENNTRMRTLFAELGDVELVAREGGTMELVVAVPPGGLGSLAALLRHAAQGH